MKKNKRKQTRKGEDRKQQWREKVEKGKRSGIRLRNWEDPMFDRMQP